MIECPKCQNENTLDSKFCRQCGAGLPEDQIEALRAENAKLVEDGVRLFDKSRVSEAKMVAESVLEIDPADTGALALLADCFERTGHYHDALELCERIAVLRPDDSVARIRVDHIRGMIEAEELAVAPVNNRKTALIAAVAATVLLFSVGTAFTLSAMDQSSSTQVAEVTEKSGEAIAFQPIAPVPTGGSLTPPSTGGNAGAGSALQDPTGAGETGAGLSQPGVVEDTSSTVSRPGRRGGAGVGSSQPYNDPGYQPLVPPGLPGGISIAPTGDGSRQPSPGNDPSGTFVPGGGSAGSQASGGAGEGDGRATEPSNNEPPKSEGIIEIQVKDGKPNPDGGAQPNNGGGGQERLSVTALVSKARDLFLQGKYADAASSYEAALRSGASPGSTNQRIAQCYEKLGQKAKALAAYRKAAAAYEASLKNGGGNARIQTSFDACQQAIKALGG